VDAAWTRLLRRGTGKMKDIVVGVLVGLVMLVAFIGVLWLMSRSTEANEEECRSEVDRHGGTCIVVTR
jgi:flagellar basal body-associated protein FliL